MRFNNFFNLGTLLSWNKEVQITYSFLKDANWFDTIEKFVSHIFVLQPENNAATFERTLLVSFQYFHAASYNILSANIIIIFKQDVASQPNISKIRPPKIILDTAKQSCCFAKLLYWSTAFVFSYLIYVLEKPLIIHICLQKNFFWWKDRYIFLKKLNNIVCETTYIFATQLLIAEHFIGLRGVGDARIPQLEESSRITKNQWDALAHIRKVGYRSHPSCIQSMWPVSSINTWSPSKKYVKTKTEFDRI